jgi:hypothetical protein
MSLNRFGCIRLLFLFLYRLLDVVLYIFLFIAGGTKKPCVAMCRMVGELIDLMFSSVASFAKKSFVCNFLLVKNLLTQNHPIFANHSVHDK